MDRVADLRADYDALGEKLTAAEGSAAAALVRERRLISELLSALEKPKVVPKVDEVGARREAKAATGRPPGRRRQSR